MKISKKKAFSLVELSIVMLVIGIIIAGVTQGSRLISQFNLSSARTLTKSSPVASMLDLAMWLETTLEESINAAESEDNSAVSIWRDINPNSSNKNNAIQDVQDDRPLYILNCINSLPCLRFDDEGKHFSYDGDFLVNTNYSIIIVEQRRSDRDENYFLSSNITEDVQNNGRLHLGYRSDSTLTFAQWQNDYDAYIDSYSGPVPRIHTFIFSSTAGKKYYINDDELFIYSPWGDSVATDGLILNDAAVIGGPQDAYNFVGDVAEIIMFTRAIKTEEFQEIIKYLSKKWNIS